MSEWTHATIALNKDLGQHDEMANTLWPAAGDRRNSMFGQDS
jgi:hypothetical protein